MTQHGRSISARKATPYGGTLQDGARTTCPRVARTDGSVLRWFRITSTGFGPGVVWGSRRCAATGRIP